MSTEAKAAANVAAQEEVTLTGSHTHKGIAIEVGEKIYVTPKQKAFLVEHGKVAAPAKQEAK
ncbi:hypothetical protein [Pseudomonas sp. GV071]|uniref:DUF7210 family protein n=1 Tax=Pseudomonas sp. GV071 TaxID=2135754 RepID=UPI000D381A30|nr:hypothetical protein [Pseudomonas sp. GV071]PTQ70355.1 hypothetical protein C8K61_10677 [Pseudomonas sp. GV071]